MARPQDRREALCTPVAPGTRVWKLSRKPFKSKLQVNTVKGVVDHPYVEGTKGYTFEEDDSIVRCSYVEAVL